MLLAIATCFAAGIEARDHLPAQVDDLRLAIDADATIRVVRPDRNDRRVERRGVDPVQCGLVEVSVFSGSGELVVAGDRLHQMLERHSLELVAHDLFCQLLERIGFEERAIGRVGDEGEAKLPTAAIDRRLIEDRPTRPARIVGGLRALVHRERGIDRVSAAVLRLDLLHAAVPPIKRLEVFARAVRAGWKLCVAATTPREGKLVIEALPDLVHGADMLPARVADCDALRPGEKEGGVARIKSVAAVAGADHAVDAGRTAVMSVVQHHAGEVGADLHRRDDAAAVVVQLADEGVAVLHRVFGPAWVHHGAQLLVADHAAGADDDGLAASDIDLLALLVDVAIVPVTFEALSGLRVQARRVARLHAEHTARELLLADDFVHVPVHHEANALFTGAELETPRRGKAALDPAQRTGVSSRQLRILAGIEERVALIHLAAGILTRNRAGLAVRYISELQDGARAASPRHAAALVRTFDARKADVIVEHELPGGNAVVGVGALHLAVIEPVGRHAARIHHRPVSHVDKEALGIILISHGLIAGRGKPHVLGVGALAVTLLDRIAATE